MDDLEDQLQELIKTICSHQLLNSPKRRKYLNKFFQLLFRLGRRWKTRGTYNEDIYEHALLETVENIVMNICETYKPEKGKFISYFKTCLDNKCKDKQRAENRHKNRRISGWEGDNGEKPVDEPTSPVDGALYLRIWEDFRQWVIDDPDDCLRTCHVEGNPKANCQALTYLNRCVGKEWSEIATEVNSPRGTISAHFSRKCKHHLREWWEKNQILFGEE